MSRNHRKIPSRAWQDFRRKILIRDNWTCAACGGYGNECDHILPLAAGGAPLDPANAQILCAGCHIRKTRAENSAPEIPGRAEWRAFARELFR